MASIFTIGHSTHESAAFVELLRDAGIELLVDVRRFPSSRRFPWFNGPELARSLASAGIDYVHEEALGGRRDPVPGSVNRGWRVGQFRGYADHMATPEFGAALSRIVAERRRVCVMCAEAQWWRCHRRLLSDALVARGIAVVHLDARGRPQPHQLTDFAVVEGEHVSYPPVQAELDVSDN
jgi:uncharacterized protein (DUF488 family)